MTIAEKLASKLEARRRCIQTGNMEWTLKHNNSIITLMEEAPRGSGLDQGITLQYDDSGDERLVFRTAFHHMDENGYYDGWTEHRVTVRPGFTGLRITILGPNRNEIKNYLHEVFHHWLTSPAAPPAVPSEPRSTT